MYNYFILKPPAFFKANQIKKIKQKYIYYFILSYIFNDINSEVIITKKF